MSCWCLLSCSRMHAGVTVSSISWRFIQGLSYLPMPEVQRASVNTIDKYTGMHLSRRFCCCALRLSLVVGSHSAAALASAAARVSSCLRFCMHVHSVFLLYNVNQGRACANTITCRSSFLLAFVLRAFASWALRFDPFGVRAPPLSPPPSVPEVPSFSCSNQEAREDENRTKQRRGAINQNFRDQLLY